MSEVLYRSAECDGEPDDWWYDHPYEAAIDVLDSLPIDEWGSTVTVFVYGIMEGCPACGAECDCGAVDDGPWYEPAGEEEVDTLEAIRAEAPDWLSQPEVSQWVAELESERDGLARQLDEARREIGRLTAEGVVALRVIAFAAIPLEALLASECDDEATALNPAMKADTRDAVAMIREFIGNKEGDE